MQQLLLHLVEHVARLGRELDLHEHQQRLAQRLGRHVRVIAGDDAVALHALDALGAGRGRQADALGQFGHGNAALALQQVEDLAVDSVEFGHFTPRGALDGFRQRFSRPKT
ncbi:hypothetical protein D3C78_1596690 [compost metagenome]